VTSGADVSISVSPGHTDGGIPPEILNSLEIFGWCKFLHVVPALLTDTAVFFSHGICKKKCCSQVRFSNSKYTKMLRPGPHWGNYRVPRLASCMVFREPFAAGEGERGRRRKRRRKGKGASIPPLFLQFNHCSYSSVYCCCDVYTVARLSSSACV